MKDWELNPDGKVKVRPLTGWQSATLPMALVLRLQYAETEDQLKSGNFEHFPIGMTAAQCAELGRFLLLKSEEIGKQSLGTKQ